MKIKNGILIFFCMILLAGSCVNMGKKIIFQREQEQTETGETSSLYQSGGIIESQDPNLPEWLGAFINGGIPGTEALGAYKNRYVFIGKNQGTNFNALRQWADRFSAAQDFPRLVAGRIEERMLASASLYPDDEYGQYFELLIKNASDAEYEGASKEESFWIKRQSVYNAPVTDTESERNAEDRNIYEFFVLISIDKTMMQIHIKQLLANVKTVTRPTRAQNAAINRIRENFFEGF